MRRLYLMRHAKTEPGGPGLDDASRCLTSRGLQDAMALAEWLGRELPGPVTVLSSTARRTRETLGLVLPYLSSTVDIRVEEGLYLASATELLARVAKLPDSVGTALLIGHNDGIHEAAVALARSGDPDLLARLRSKFPTAAVAGIGFAGTWKTLPRSGGELLACTSPAELRCG